MKILLASLLILLLLAGCGSVVVVNGNDDYTTETTTEYTTIEEETTATQATTMQAPTPMTIDGMVWRVAPTLNYERVWRCDCGIFLTDGGRELNLITGEAMHPYSGGHGPFNQDWFYDPVLGLLGHAHFGDGYFAGYGMHPVNSFEQSALATLTEWLAEHSTTAQIQAQVQQFAESSIRRMIVQSVDSTQRADSGWNNDWHLQHPNAFLGRFAIIENRRPISPWFDAITYGEGNAMFAAANGDAWQFINHRGVPLFPMQFEHIVLIDSESAFVRHNGRYGILDIHATATNF